MRCHDAAATLMDGPEARTPEQSRELKAHLEGCDECRALAALHASASALRLPLPPTLAPVSRDAVLGEVRRRVIRRRAGAVASLCLAAVLLWPRPPEPVPGAGGPDGHHSMEGASALRPELGLAREPREDAFSEEDVAPEPTLVATGRGSLLQLMGEVRGYTRRDLVVHDEAYRPYGTLAAWLRPPDSRALETPPFRTAVLPLYPQESMQ
ncbi:hypothetical protein ACLESD_04990 [Pyxidicoccus sp. 3LFB2]